MRGRKRHTPLPVQLPNRLRERRQELGLSLATLSTSTGFKPQTIQRHETGENQVSISQLETYARALDCTPEELLRNGVRLTPRLRALLRLAAQLPEEQQETLLRLGDALKEPSKLADAG